METVSFLAYYYGHMVTYLFTYLPPAGSSSLVTGSLHSETQNMHTLQKKKKKEEFHLNTRHIKQCKNAISVY